MKPEVSFTSELVRLKWHVLAKVPRDVAHELGLQEGDRLALQVRMCKTIRFEDEARQRFANDEDLYVEVPLEPLEAPGDKYDFSGEVASRPDDGKRILDDIEARGRAWRAKEERRAPLIREALARTPTGDCDCGGIDRCAEGDHWIRPSDPDPVHVNGKHLCLWHAFHELLTRILPESQVPVADEPASEDGK